MIPRAVFVAVRCASDSAVPWIDLATISGSRAVVEEKVDKIAHEIPEWAKANPVVRIAKFELAEVKS